MPPILQYGFRPFFFLAALHAGLAIPVWLWMYFSGYALPGPFTGLEWHVHEMLFGYLAAIVTGFLLNTVYAITKPSVVSLLSAVVRREDLSEAVSLNTLQFTICVRH